MLLGRRGNLHGKRFLINVVDFELLNQLTKPQGSEKERRKGPESQPGVNSYRTNCRLIRRDEQGIGPDEQWRK